MKTSEILDLLQISRELDIQYGLEVKKAVDYSNNKEKAVNALKKAVDKTILIIGGRDYEYDVTCELNRRRDRKCI